MSCRSRPGSASETGFSLLLKYPGGGRRPVGVEPPNARPGLDGPAALPPLASRQRGGHIPTMSKSTARVAAALKAAGLDAEIVEPGPARTAEEAAAACGCALDQIVKSLIFQGESGQLYLFLTAGGNRVNPARAAALAGEQLGRADADTVRATTGFAIGGVAPLGHLTAPVIFADPRLTEFPEVWAAAGTPRHVFAAAPDALIAACKARIADFTA